MSNYRVSKGAVSHGDVSDGDVVVVVARLVAAVAIYVDAGQCGQIGLFLKSPRNKFS